MRAIPIPSMMGCERILAVGERKRHPGVVNQKTAAECHSESRLHRDEESGEAAPTPPDASRSL